MERTQISGTQETVKDPSHKLPWHSRVGKLSSCSPHTGSKGCDISVTVLKGGLRIVAELRSS